MAGGFKLAETQVSVIEVYTIYACSVLPVSSVGLASVCLFHWKSFIHVLIHILISPHSLTQHLQVARLPQARLVDQIR